MSIENFPYSSSQVAQVLGTDSTVGDIDYYSDSPPQGGVRNKDNSYPTPEVEEFKEVTEVSSINRPLPPSTPQPDL